MVLLNGSGHTTFPSQSSFNGSYSAYLSLQAGGSGAQPGAASPSLTARQWSRLGRCLPQSEMPLYECLLLNSKASLQTGLAAR